jgi:hypothetical protein
MGLKILPDPIGKLGGGGMSVVGGGGVVYLLRDLYTDALAAGLVNGTLATDGINLRTVADAENLLSLSGGKLVIAGGRATPDFGNPGLRYPAIITAAGVTLIASINVTNAGYFIIGYGSTATLADIPDRSAFYVQTTALVIYHAQNPSANLATIVPGTDYQFKIEFLASGANYWIKGGIYADWILIYTSATALPATLYPKVSNYQAAIAVDSLEIL